MGGKPSKKVRSFTLCERSYQKLKKHAKEEHKGNMSDALRSILLTTIPTTLEDFSHHQEEKFRNYMGTGKCNPTRGGYPCVLCWGENASVSISEALIEREGRWIKERVINVENS